MAVSHSVANDARRRLELEELLAILLVDGFEVAFERAVEGNAASGGQSARPDRELLRLRPDDLALCTVPSDEVTHTLRFIRTREHGQRGANVRLTSRVRNLEGFVVHANVVRRNIEQAGQLRERSRLLVLRTESRRANALRVDVCTVLERRVLCDADRTAIVLRGLVHVDAGCPVHDRIILLSDEKLARCAIPGVAEAVTVKVSCRFALRSIEIELGEDRLVDAVIVPLVERRHLVCPLGNTGVDVTSEHGHRPTLIDRLAIRSRTLCRVPGRGVAGPVVDQVEFRIEGHVAPGRTATDLPLIAVPGLERGVLADRLAERRGLLRIDQDVRIRAHRVGAPDLLTAVDVVGGDVAANAELSARDTDDHLVLRDKRSTSARLALLRIAVDDLPQFLTRLRVESDERRVGLVEEDLAFSVLNATVNRVAAHHGDDRGVLLRGVLPDDLLFVGKVQSEHDVRERRVKVHRVTDHERAAFVTTKNAGRERPCHFQLTNVFGVDLVQRRIPGAGVVAGLLCPVIRIARQLGNVIVRPDGRRERGCCEQTVGECTFAHRASSILRKVLPRLQVEPENSR